MLTISTAKACCGLASEGSNVYFGNQRNIVIWDKQKSIEHFVRYANFGTDAAGMAFIAPTPSLPEIVEIDPTAYESLASLGPKLPTGTLDREDGVRSASAAAMVVQTIEVGPYIATTLKSDDADAIVKYLKENSFFMPNGIKKWVDFYASKQWMLTAFKLKPGAKKGEINLTPIRMTFKTDRPYNPYYVPDENMTVGMGGTLSTYFISEGTYGANIPNSTKEASWHSKGLSKIHYALSQHLKLKVEDIPENAVVSYYEFGGFPSPAKDDIYFEPTNTAYRFFDDKPAEKEPVQRAPQIGGFPAAILVILVVIFGGQWYFTLKNRNKFGQ